MLSQTLFGMVIAINIDMSILPKDWLISEPKDIELKKYKLLAACQKIRDAVLNGKIFNALNSVEEELYNLYSFKSDRGRYENDAKILKGINLDTMELEYEYPESTYETDLTELSEFAIDQLEDIFKFIRAKWRLYSKKIQITEIPTQRPTKNKGYVLIEDKSKDNILIYYYDNMNIKDWRKFELTKHTEIKKEIGNVSEWIQTVEDNENCRFFRASHSLDCCLNDCIIPLIKYNLFYKITVS